MNNINTGDKEIIVLGNGLAGMTAAIFAAKNGARVKIVSKNFPDRSQSVMAAGGINAALDNKGQNDSTQQHFADTMKAGCYIADENAVRNLVETAPKVIEWLQSIGTVLSMTADNRPDQRYFGGQKKMRTVYSKSGIGRQLVSGLSAEMNKYIYNGKISEYLCSDFVQLIFGEDKKTAVGVEIKSCVTGQRTKLYGSSVIVCTGGMNGLFGSTTGSVLNTGYVTAKLFEQGARLGNLEMIQYHPTTVKTASKQMLISEAARGEGGRLFVYRGNERWYFMEDIYPEGKNLMPRDVVSYEEYRQAVLNDYGQVYLDLTELSDDVINNKLREVKDVCEIYLGINPQKDFIPVKPAVHYFMGGIIADKNHRTNIPSVYAVGECACIYHGSNRLGGNSTLAAIVGGMIAGQNAVEDIEKKAFVKHSDGDTSECLISEMPNEIPNILNESMGIIRNAKTMENGLEKISGTDVYSQLARAIILSGLERKETRGAHKRNDFTQTEEEYNNTTCAYMENDEVKIKRCSQSELAEWR